MATISDWIRPWAGEYLAAEVVAISGEWYVCRCANGDRFQIRIDAYPQVLTVAEAASNVRRYGRPERPRLELVRA
jgi:hypothetical protein